MSNKLLFGEYLISQNLAKKEKIEEALRIQAHSVIPIGQLAVKMGFITRRQNIRILVMQKLRKKRFGDIAMEEGLLTKERINILIEYKRMETFFLGKILEKMGVLKRVEVLRALIKFNKKV